MPPMTREERSWILYDVANSAFVLVMVTAIMPIYFKDIAAQNLPAAVSTSYWGFANAAASSVLALLAPILGALADYRARKKRFFLIFLTGGLFFTLLLALLGTGQWLLCLALFALARVGWAGANIFYDSFLVDISPSHRMDTISARGYAYGYIGSVIPFLLVIGVILSAGTGETLPGPQTRLGFVIVAVWWLLFSIPIIRNLRQKSSPPAGSTTAPGSFHRLFQTLQNIRKHRHAFVFLLAYFFYIDGVGTVISMATVYGRDLGFGVTMLILVLLFIQVVAFPFSLFFGTLANRFGAKNTLLAGIAVYSLVTLLAFLLPFFPSPVVRTALFWLIALLVASAMGGIQALSRSYFGKLIPVAKSAEFFGFYNVFGKFAAISGPLLMGVITHMTGDSRWGVLSILLLFAIGGWILATIDEKETAL